MELLEQPKYCFSISRSFFLRVKEPYSENKQTVNSTKTTLIAFNYIMLLKWTAPHSIRVSETAGNGRANVCKNRRVKTLTALCFIGF